SSPDNLKGYGIPDYCSASTLLSNTTTTSAQGNFSVYPNPNNGEMIFSLATFSNDNGTIEIYDATGKLVRTINVLTGEKNISVDETNLNDGIYFCRYVVNGNEVGNVKMAIAR
ncbi:MAG: T9SS type A sorting domain-containing protein, partial [Bacteroidia bacterium]